MIHTCRSVLVTSLAASAVVMLAGCTQQKTVLPVLKTEANLLNLKLQRSAILANAQEQQTMLNRQTTDGLFLLPAAQSTAILRTNIGELSISLTHIVREIDGVRISLLIKNNDGSSNLPAFNASLDWGQLDSVSGQPLTISMLSQNIQVKLEPISTSEYTVEVRLAYVSPKTLGFIHLHSITPLSKKIQ